MNPYLPGQQTSVLQDAVCVLDPLHESPPPNGVGLVHVLDLSFVPPPQVTEHDP